MEQTSPIMRLAELLSTSGAEPEITAERLAPSTLYDLEYRAVIVATAFRMHSVVDRFSTRPRIQNRRLKLLQFVAMRPWLLPVIRNWSSSRSDSMRLIDGEEGSRKGFTTDSMHDKVMQFLAASGALRREDVFVIPGVKPTVLEDLQGLAEKNALFESEINALNELRNITVTTDMLEGW
jgi:hypothetical protein